MAPCGGCNYRLQTRFARFQNVPEMLRLWHVFADVKTVEGLQLPTPQLWPRDDGQRLPETVLVEASPELGAYVAQLGECAEAVRAKRVAPEEDNMLKISTDGRRPRWTCAWSQGSRRRRRPSSCRRAHRPHLA